MIKIKKSTEKDRNSFLTWMVVIGVVLIVSYAAIMGIKSKPRKKASTNNGAFSQSTEAEDPVCKMIVKPPAEGHLEYRGKLYYFCSIVCRETFEKGPGEYVK